MLFSYLRNAVHLFTVGTDFNMICPKRWSRIFAFNYKKPFRNLEQELRKYIIRGRQNYQ